MSGEERASDAVWNRKRNRTTRRDALGRLNAQVSSLALSLSPPIYLLWSELSSRAALRIQTTTRSSQRRPDSRAQRSTTQWWARARTRPREVRARRPPARHIGQRRVVGLRAADLRAGARARSLARARPIILSGGFMRAAMERSCSSRNACTRSRERELFSLLHARLFVQSRMRSTFAQVKPAKGSSRRTDIPTLLGGLAGKRMRR